MYQVEKLSVDSLWNHRVEVEKMKVGYTISDRNWKKTARFRLKIQAKLMIWKKVEEYLRLF